MFIDYHTSPNRKAASIFELTANLIREDFKFIGKDYLRILKFILIVLWPVRYPAVLKSINDLSKLENFDSNLGSDLGFQFKMIFVILFPWRYITFYENFEWKMLWDAMNHFKNPVPHEIINFTIGVSFWDILILPFTFIHACGPLRYMSTYKLYWNSNVKD